MRKFVKDESNGVSTSAKAGGLTISMTYRPTDFLIWQDAATETDDEVILKLMHNYSNYYYYVMQLSAGEKDALYGTSADQLDFSEKLQTLSFRMPEYINVTTSELDTIPLADAYYSRMFGMSQSNDILLVFNNEDIQTDEWLSINVKEFGFKTGRRSFRFNLDEINNTPKLLELKAYYELTAKKKPDSAIE